MYDKAKRKIKKNDKKINAIFVLLLITNIILYARMIQYYLQIHFTIEFSTINNIITIFSAIIILGYISTILPKFRDMGDSNLYEAGYLIIMGLLSITISYFNSSTNGQFLWAPFIDMFKVLSVLLIFTLIATRFKSFKDLLHGKTTIKNQIICIIIFGIIGILASRYTVNINGIPANVRCLIIMISGLFGGPIVGIPSALIAGSYNYMIGGTTAIPYAITTIISGIIGSIIYIWNDKKFLGTVKSAILMFLFVGFDMFLINLLTNESVSIPLINTTYPPMLFASVLGIILFSMIIAERNDYEKDDINSIIEKQNEKIEKLEKKLDELEK